MAPTEADNKPYGTLSPPPFVSPLSPMSPTASTALHPVHLRRKNATRRVRKRSSASAAPRITTTSYAGRKTSRVESAISPLLPLQSSCSTPSPPQSFILSPAAAAAVLPSVAVSSPTGWLGILRNQPSPVMGTKRKRKALSEGGEICLHTEDGEQRILRGVCDWGPDAVDGDHLWCPTSVSGDFCYVREQDCTRQGPRMKCSACKIIAHAGCIQHLMEKVRFTCKPTFRDVGVRAYREQTAIHHHWVHRRSQKGKCKHCGKSFQSKLSFSSKEIVAIGCSWCKAAYHNKTSCFGLHRIEEQCNLGLHSSIIVPPSWIVKLPPKGNFKSSLRKPTKKKSSSKKKKEKVKVSPSASASGIELGPGQGLDANGGKNREEKDKINKFFAIKPIPSTKLKPVLIFINPKSGGNQGLKLMQKFQWLLNPRQVFDLSQGGPTAGLDLFRKVPNLRILACGGDGTVGWIFSELDKMGIEPPPPVGVLPLGTGNDLARALGWGGGYTDEPISKILCHIEDGDIVQLDRWTLKVEPNLEAHAESQKSCASGDSTFDEGEVKDSPPLNVVNNYFSIGVDAHIALEFHEAREAHPEKFNSRIRNKMFYGQMGGKDLLQRKWKDLTDYVSLECDGKDFTPKIREHKFHALLFLNIPSYGGGTRPWNNACGKQQTDDGRLEVIGLTTYQLPLLQAGGHGTCISQCQTAKIVTRKTIPMQVDGEACRVKPSVIHLSVLNKAHVVTKRRGRTSHPDGPARLEQVRLQVSRIGMADYERYHYDKEKLKEISLPLGLIVVDQEADLEQVRMHINRLWEDLSKTNNGSFPALSPDWCFLDSCTAERYFRIDRAQESLHYVMDISGDELNILDPDLVTTRPKPDDDASTSEKDTTSANSEQHVNGGDASLLERHSAEVIAAAEKGDLKWLKDLSSKGYSLLSIDENGRTALHHAAMNGHMDIVRFLIASAPVTILDMVDAETGQTALHLAGSARRRNICCMLVAAGGSLTQKDAQGQTPRELALLAGDQELANYLKSQETFQKMVSSNMETTV